jgi:hypothetical protein
LALSEVLAIAARMRCMDEYWLLTAERDGKPDEQQEMVGKK